MRILIVIMMMWSAMSTNAQEIWQLTPWPPDSNYVLGALPSGEPTWVKVDSLGVADSIYLSGDSIMLRDGSGFVILKDTSSTNELPAIYYYFASLPSTTGTKIGDYAWDGGTNWHISDGSNWYLLSSGDFSIVKNNFTSNDSTYMWRYVHENNVSGDIGIVAKEKTGLLLEGNNNQKVMLSIDTSFIATVNDLNKIKDSTIVQNSYGTIITETPANTFNIAVDSSLFATTYDITQISTESDSIQRSGNIISLRDGSGSVDISDLVNAADSTIVQNSYGTIITESPTNTYNVKVDSSLFATTYDIAQKQNIITGTSGQTLRFDGTNSLIANSLLYNVGNQIGIGTITPTASYILDVAGNTKVRDGFLTVDNTVFINAATTLNMYNSANTGIFHSYQDGATSTDNIVYRGQYKTFTIGYNAGAGQSYANVANKKLHVNGAVSIGDGVSATSVAANSLLVEGSVTVQDRTGTASTLSAFDTNGKLVGATLGTGLSWSGNTLNGNVGNVTGSGVATRVAFWNGGSSLSSNSNLFWDNEYNSLGIGGYPSPASKLHLIGGDLFIIGGDNRRFLLGNNTSGNGFGGMKWSTANEMHYIHSGYNENTGVMLTNSLGYTGLRTQGVTPTTPLDIFSSTNTDGGTYQKWAFGSAPNTYNLNLKQTYTSGNVRYNFSQVNGGTAYNNVLVFDRGKIALNHVDAARQLDVNGEVRIRDLVTDTPIRIVGADADGDLGEITLGTGLSWSGNTLNGNVGNVTGSGVATRVAFWNGTNSLSSNSNLFWDNEYNSLGIGGYPSPASKLHLIGGDLFIIGGDNRRFLLGNNTSGNGFGGMKWSTANEMHYIHSGYNENTGVMLTNSLGYTGLRTQGVTPTTPLDIFSSTNTDGGTYQKWAFGSAPNTYNLNLKQTYTSGNVRYNFSQVNGGTAYDNVLVFNQGKIGIGLIDPGTKLHVNGDFTVDTRTGTPAKMAAFTSTGVLCETTLPTSPLTWGDFTSNIQSWNSTGTFGSGKDVGIGGQPTQDFDVNGNARLRGAIYNSSNSAGTTGQVLTSQGTGSWIWSTPVDQSTTNELQNLSLSGQSLGISSGTGVTLPIVDVVGGFGVAVNKTSGVATLSKSAPYSNMSINDYTKTLSTSYQKLAISGQSSTNGDGVNLTYDNTNNEIDITVTGTYKFGFTVNCKSNTAGHEVTFDVLDASGGAHYCETKHYFNNTNEYCHNNMFWVSPITAPASLSVHAKTTATSSPNINNCSVRFYAERLK